MNHASYPMLPIWNEDGTGYVFVTVVPQSKPVAVDPNNENRFSVEVRPSISGGGVTTSAVLKDGAADNGLTFAFRVDCVDATGAVSETLEFVVSDELVKSVYTNGTSIKLTVNGANSTFAKYVINLVITSDTGLSYSSVVGEFVPVVADAE